MGSPAHQPRDFGNHRVEIFWANNDVQLAIYDFAVAPSLSPRILVLKLDHLGDFLIGLPALMELRAIFPKSHITLICGPWNITTARELGLVDEIRSYEYFPENAQGWGGDAIEDLDRFREICKGRFDIAMDLRVDEDTRPLLRHIDAALRCGIGARSRHPYLNVALPDQFGTRERQQIKQEPLVFRPGAFQSRMPIQTPFFHETDFSVTDSHVIYGPYSRLPLGNLRAEFAFELLAPTPSLRRIEIAVEVVRNGHSDVVAFKRSRLPSKHRLVTLHLPFRNDDPTARYEFRVFVGGRFRRGAALRFFGVRIELAEKEPQGARLLSAELHTGEQLSLLVALVGKRVRPLYEPGLFKPVVSRHEIAMIKSTRSWPSAKRIVIAPFSNSTIRDWPLDRYKRLLDLLLGELGTQIVLVGTRDQAAQLSSLCQPHDGNDRLMNLTGQTDWSELAAVLRQADLVIANNSGVAHLAATCGTPTLAIYSGSHQPQEWGPRGQTIRVITAVVSCSPCGFEKLELCPHDHLCMTLIEPETVMQHARAMLDRRVAHFEPHAGKAEGQAGNIERVEPIACDRAVLDQDFPGSGSNVHTGQQDF
jgi:ADP-heptose:LPS heptosyltransferase